ncbi:MAG TPA: cell division protein FtsQ/DivIB [Steroidobacteraceae bacterium]|nr:cell division protein FtsQ/DivIB [Steroidobacteraceae bacterium]
MLSRPKNRRKQNEARWSLFGSKEPAAKAKPTDWRRWGMTFGSLVGLGAAIAVVTWTLDQPITSVAVFGRFQRVSATEVERAVKLKVRNVGLVSVDLGAVRQAIASIPWVDVVTVQRAWPHGLRVVVAEQVAAARWRENGLLNTRGELFASDARNVPIELAQLSGPDGTENEVAQRYLASQGRLAEAGLRITAVRLDARGAWEFDLGNGVTVRLGRRQIDERFERFMTTAVKLIAQRADDIAYVDMRYTNGFAIGWRGAVARHAAEDGSKDV